MGLYNYPPFTHSKFEALKFLLHLSRLWTRRRHRLLFTRL